MALSASGAASVGYGLQDADNAASSVAYLAEGSLRGRFARPVSAPQFQQVLGLAYLGDKLQLLAGGSEAGQPCCSSVETLGAPHHGRFGRTRTLVTGLAGPTVAQLVTLPHRLLAVIATERGVWASLSSGTRFSSTRQLTTSAQLPQQVSATALQGGESLVAWSARTGRLTDPGPRFVYLARGSAHSAPRGGHVVLTVSANREIDELALVGSGHRGTLAVVESWFDAQGNFHSQVKVADLHGRVRLRTLSASSELASGISFAAGAGGSEVLSWEGCDANGNCSLRVALRSAKGGFGRARNLGSADPDEPPSVALTASGHAVVGWIRGGDVLAVTSRRTGLTRAVRLSSTGDAANLDIAPGPSRGAMAVWSEGTAAERLVGSSWLEG